MSQPSVQYSISACKDAYYELKRLAIPQNAPPSVQFYPRDKIRDFLTRSKVEEILRCHRKCLECRTHLEQLQVGTSQGTVDPVRQCLDRISLSSRNGQLIPDDEALSLFALMIVLRSPLLVIPFVYEPTWGLDTYGKERKGNVTDEIKRVQARYFNCLKPEEGEVLAGSFVQEVFKFSSPVFNHTGFTQFHDDTVLPFLHTRLLGEGSFGEVFAFELYPYYNELPSPFRTPNDGFARKEIRVKNLSQSSGQSQPDISRAIFHKEVNNLVLLNESLRDDHIVQIVKPYGIGNKMNIIFPCARANLNQCLRDDSYNLAELNCIPIRNCLIWKQMSGIATALNRILAGVKTEDGRELLGYHFDLKPANILVYGKDPETYTFKITDFGLSWFKKPDGGSNTLPFMGDGRYMPPEAAPDRTSNRRHDIWSFGCILLEATVFVVRSYRGVKKLDDACRMEASAEPQAYFERDPVDGSARIRQKVLEYMDNDVLAFVQDDANFSEEDKALIRGIILLIKGMLEPIPHHRLTSEEVVKNFGRLSSLWDYAAHHTDHSALATPDPGEVEIGADILHNTERLAIKLNREPTKEPLQAAVQIFEDQHSCLRFVATPVNITNAQPYEGGGLRSDLLLVPQYAMDKVFVAGRSDTIRLVWASKPEADVLRFDFTGSLKELRMLQGVLLGQNIHASIQLRDVDLKTPFTVAPVVRKPFVKAWSWIRMATGGSRVVTEGDIAEQGPYTIQLWREEDPDVSLTGTDWKGHPCHFVIFYASKIIIVPFKKTIRITKLSRAELLDPSLVELEIMPMQSHMHRTFDMVVLELAKNTDRSSCGNSAAPALPLCKKKFSAMMRTLELTHEFESFKLTFKQHNDLIAFRRSYLTLRRDWLGEQGAIE